MHGKEHRLLFARQHFQPPSVRTNGDDVQAGQVPCPVQADARLAGHERRAVFVGQGQPAGVEEHDIALADGHALSLGLRLDFRFVEHRAGGQAALAEVPCHVQQHAAPHHRRQFVDGELRQPPRRHEVLGREAVVVDVVDAHVPKPVELAADAHPRVEQIVVAGGQVLAHRRPVVEAGLDDGDGVVPGRIGRRLPAGDDPQRIGLAGLHQPRRLHHLLRRQVVERAKPVLRPVFGRMPALHIGAAGVERDDAQ